MHTRSLVAVGVFACVLSGALFVGAAPATQAPPGAITFTARNLIARAEGTFHAWRFTRVEGDRKRPETGVVEVEVDVASIDTGNESRDEHLRTDDFFDAARFPTAYAKLYGLEARGERNGHPLYAVQMDLRIRDVTRTVETEFELVQADPPTVEGTLVIDRTDFGIGKPHSRWNPLSVREDVPVRFRAVLPDPGRSPSGD